MEYVKIEILNHQQLDKILGTDPQMEEVLRNCIRKGLQSARRGAVKAMKSEVGVGYEHSNGDPRDAYKAIKHSVYRRELGGSISILAKRKANNTRLEGKGLQTYYGSDRGFILRFLNSGTPRRDDRRGKIAKRGMFDRIGNDAIEQAKAEINRLFAEKIEQRINETQQ